MFHVCNKYGCEIIIYLLCFTSLYIVTDLVHCDRGIQTLHGTHREGVQNIWY
jgi:hypothetical protein